MANDPFAIHTNVAAEISTIPSVAPALGDIFVTEDVSNANVKNRITLQQILQLITQLSNIMSGYIYGLPMTWVSATQVSIGPGICRNIADNFTLVNAGTLTANITVVGANGRDAGVEAANTWYHLWLIADSTGVNPVASLLSTSTTVAGLTFPAGYDVARRVGAVRNNASSNFIDFTQTIHTGVTRTVEYIHQSFATMTVLSGYSVVAYTTVNCNGFVPQTARSIRINYDSDSSSLVDSHVYFREAGSGTGSPVTLGNCYGGDSGSLPLYTNASQQIEVAVGSALTSVSVAMLAYDDPLEQ